MQRVLVVEDDPIIAIDLSEQLTGAGYETIGPAFTAQEGLALLDQERCDVAVLDVNLGRETSEAVAHALIRRSVPFVTVSGYASDQHPPVFRDAPLVVKPVRLDKLLETLDRLVGGRADRRELR